MKNVQVFVEFTTGHITVESDVIVNEISMFDPLH